MQHDMDVGGGGGASVRADFNGALQALATASSGTTAPATTYPYQFWADTTAGVLRQRNAANTAWIVRAPLAETLVVARAANTVLGVGDWGRSIIATGTWAQTLVAAATLGDGWYVDVRNNGTGVITIDPNGSETIDGVATIQLAPGESCFILCNGVAFFSIGRTASDIQRQIATAFTSAGAAPAFVLTPVPALTAYAASVRFHVKFHAAGVGADTLNISGLGAKSIKQYDSAGAKVPAVIKAGQLADVEYDGVDFVILAGLPAATQVLATAAALDDLRASGFYVCFGANADGEVLHIQHPGSNGYAVQLMFGQWGQVPTTAGNGLSYRALVGGAWTAWQKIWHAGNLDPAALPSLGVGQTWQNVSGGRAAGTTYYNTTGKPIVVNVKTAIGSNSTVLITATVSGVSFLLAADNSAQYPIAAGHFIVPPGGSYSFTITSATLSEVHELR